MVGVTTALPLRVGVDEAGVDVELDLVRDGHVIVAGASRSGKSVLAYSALGAIGARKHPVRVVGVDPTGLLLGPFAADPLVVLDATDDQRIVHVLGEVVQIHRDRLAELRRRNLDKFTSVDPDGPVILVVIEEFQALLDELGIADRVRKPADRVRPVVEALVDSILAGGAKTQVKMLLLMQRASAKKIDTDSRANFGTRIAMRVDDDESLPLLFPDIDKAVSRRIQQCSAGFGVVKMPGRPLRVFRADNVTYSDYRRATT